MAAELNEDRRALIRDAAEDTGLTVEIDDDGRGWQLTGPPGSIYRFFARLGARNSVFAEVLADCIEGAGFSLTDSTWEFPAYEWGEVPDYDGLGNYYDDDEEEEDDEPAPASSTISAEETTQS